MVSDLNKPLKNFKEKQLNKSAGILDDFAIRKNIATREGTITKTPVNPNDIVNKSYADTKLSAETDPVFVAWDKSHTSLINIGTNAHSVIDTHLGLTNAHIDWTADQGATNIHAGNYTDTNTTDHTAFSNIGTNTHAQIDTHISGTGTAVHGDSFLLNTGDTSTGAIIINPAYATNAYLQYMVAGTPIGILSSRNAIDGGTDDHMGLYVYGANDLTFWTANNIRMTVKGDGKVGIGTETPTSKLHVVGLVDYANNAAAVTGGLTAGAFYAETGTNPKKVCVVY